MAQHCTAEDFDEQLLGFEGLSLGTTGDDLLVPKLETPPLSSPPQPPQQQQEQEQQLQLAHKLVLVEWPESRVRDGACILQGGASVSYRFALQLVPHNVGGAMLTTQLIVPRAAGAGERVSEDGLRGNDPPVPFDPLTGIAALRLRFESAGRGALWTLRFIAVDASVSGVELCRLDCPVRTFSKKAKIDALLAGPGAVTAVAPPQPQPQPQAAQERRSLASVNAVAQASWTSELEQELTAMLEETGRRTVPADIAYIREACSIVSGEFAGQDGARAWVARTIAEGAKVPRLWVADAPRLLHFVSRETAEAVLRTAPVGCFLLRFSQGEPGELVVAYNAAVSTATGSSTVEQVYLRKDNEPLDEYSAVDLLIASRGLTSLLDPITHQTYPKEILRPRGRYSRCLP